MILCCHVQSLAVMMLTSSCWYNEYAARLQVLCVLSVVVLDQVVSCYWIPGGSKSLGDSPYRVTRSNLVPTTCTGEMCQHSKVVFKQQLEQRAPKLIVRPFVG